MNKILVQLSNVISQYGEQPIVVAYSGGVDSQVLLHALSQLKAQQVITNPISVCHVNHGLSDNASAWAQFAQQQCDKLDLPLFIHELNLSKISGESLEATARDARYQVFTQAFKEPSLVLTGHHLDDQAETFLLALKRGSGVQGLSAMASASTLAQHTLLRPLLAISRDEIEQYATSLALDWVEDESNQDSRFDRNFLRNEVLPLLQARWPHFNQAIARCASLCRDNQQLINELAEADLANVRQESHKQESTKQNGTGHKSNSLNLPKLMALPKSRAFNVIRLFLASHQSNMPSMAQINALFSQLESEQDKTPQVKLGQVWLRRFKDSLIATPDFEDVSDFEQTIDLTSITVNTSLKVELPDNLGQLQITRIDAFDKTNETAPTGSNNENQLVFSLASASSLIVRFNHDNPKVEPDYREKSRPLKKVLQELQLPPWQRKRLPFVFTGEQLVLVPNYFVCKAFDAKLQPDKFLIRWLQCETATVLHSK